MEGGSVDTDCIFADRGRLGFQQWWTRIDEYEMTALRDFLSWRSWQPGGKSNDVPLGRKIAALGAIEQHRHFY